MLSEDECKVFIFPNHILINYEFVLFLVFAFNVKSLKHFQLVTPVPGEELMDWFLCSVNCYATDGSM